MYDIDRKLENVVNIVDAHLGTYSTSEQKAFASDFTKPLISFSDPGTGKSHSTVKGLIVAQTYHGVPGANINAMSFTVEATAELASRYVSACKKCGITPTIKFNTFHSICRRIVQEKYKDMRIVSGFDWKSDIDAAKAYLSQLGLDTEDNYFIKRVLLACDKLNHMLVYDNTHVEMMYQFKVLGIDIDIFQGLRKKMFSRGILMRAIMQGDIPTYALYVLLKNENVRKKYQAEFEIMVVDEFQDMTKLYLKVLSLISKNLIVIGDMKQQIYGFNGACAEIVDEYMDIYPDARTVNLTNSFRCSDEIAEYATAIYKPNKLNVATFKGSGKGGSVRLVKSSGLDLSEIVSRIKSEELKTRKYVEMRELGLDISGLEVGESTMFLCRNNFSILPVIEELYQQQVPYMSKKFAKVMDIAIYKEMSILAYAAYMPEDADAVYSALSLFPEFKKYNKFNNTFIRALEKEQESKGKSVNMFNLPYSFSKQSSNEIMQVLKRVRDAICDDEKASVVYDLLLPVYEKYVIEGKWWRLDMEKEFYFSLVEKIITKKTFIEMYDEEIEKEQLNQRYLGVKAGVKCYTIHSAKGLEADNVYILEAEEALFPSKKNLKRMLSEGCEYEAATVIREERNLLYVAITRAKKVCYITYTSSLTPLIKSPFKNGYSYLDTIYARTQKNFDEVGSFLNLMKLNDKSKEMNLQKEEQGIVLQEIGEL